MDEIRKLTENDIYRKKFTKNVKGYDPLEVDQYLDEIREDYERISQYIAWSQNTIQSLKAALEEAKAQLASAGSEKEKNERLIRDYETKLASAQTRLDAIKPNDHPTTENIELLRKINTYESFLHSEGYNVNRLEHKK